MNKPTEPFKNANGEWDLSHVPTKEQLDGIDPLEVKKRAITAGYIVELDPDEADTLGVNALDTIEPDDPNYAKLEQDLLDSCFDPCEYDLDNYELIPDSLLGKKK